VLQGFDEWLLRGAEEALGEDDEVIVCARCKTEVSFEDVTKGYYAVCPEHDEDLDEWEIATVPLSKVNRCTCGRDDLETGNLGEPAEHDDGCPIWEEAKRELLEQEAGEVK
jgi:hypothetical protein